MRSVSFAIAFSAVIYAPAQAESLRSALASAYNNNAALNAQRAATRATDESLPLAKSGFRPQIIGNASIGASRTVTDIRRQGTARTSLTPYGFGITIQQSLFDGFQTINNVRAAEAGIRAAREALRNVEQNTLFNAVTAYADVLLFGEIVAIRRENIAFLREQVRSASARLEVGEATRTDVAQSEAELAQGRASLSVGEASLGSARASYFEIIGRRPNKLKWPKGPSNLYPPNLNQGIAIAANRHPAIRAGQHAVDVAAFQVKQAEGTLLPSVTLNGTAQQSFDPSATIDDVTNLEATVNVRIPIYQGGAASATVRQNKETLGQRRIEVDQARDNVRQLVVSAWTQLDSARANLKANGARVRAGRLALSGVIEERNVGQRTQLDVLDAQSALLAAQELQVQSRRDLVVAGYALVSSIGRLNSRKLRLAVKHYSPKEHYQAVKDKWYGLRTPTKR